MVVWISLGLFIGLMTAFFTLVWWKVGDQWADEEYKKFGHGGGAPKGPPPKVISNFEDEPTVVELPESSLSDSDLSKSDEG